MDLGAPELLIVLILVLLLFGGAKLPKLARSIGQAQKEFKKGLNEGFTDDDDAKDKKLATKPAEVKVIEGVVDGVPVVEKVVVKSDDPASGT
jgi:sec-independent protein translocase protein TatA